jgi:hypothetical protein
VEYHRETRTRGKPASRVPASLFFGARAGAEVLPGPRKRPSAGYSVKAWSGVKEKSRYEVRLRSQVKPGYVRGFRVTRLNFSARNGFSFEAVKMNDVPLAAP